MDKLQYILFFLFSCTVEPPDKEGMIALQLPSGKGFFIDRYEYPNQKDMHPTSMLSLQAAKERCAQKGKRLCTAQEWRYACQNGREDRYVYGVKHEAKKCLSNQRLKEGHTSLIAKEKGYAKSGSYEDCQTESGIFDMVGNLEEWVLDDWRGLTGNLEGGAWYSHWSYADCTGRYSRQPDYRISSDRTVDSAGTRCCWSAEEPTQEDIQADRDAQIRDARKMQSTTEYRIDDEVEFEPGLWIDRYEYPNRKGEVPKIAVSWEQAQSLCQQSGKRLCTVQEWERACQGKGETPYPYGKIYKESRCLESANRIAPSGSHPQCESFSKARDMVGSVWEWTASELTVSELQTEEEQSLKEVRGGSWYSDPLKARCQPIVGYPAAISTMIFPDVGFRCCRGERQKITKKERIVDVSCPSDMVSLSDSCIDRYEYPNQKGVLPLSRVDLTAAKKICLSVGKHICSTREWEEGCEGIEKRRWSYGNQYQKKVCNHNAAANSGGVSASGSHSNCHTPEGVFDMTGNLWEWTADGQVKGGNWNFSEGMGQCRSFAQPDPTFLSENNGFRCCANRDELKRLLP